MVETLAEEPFRFPYYILAWTLTVALLGIVTFPWAMLAYKIWHGSKEIDEDFREELLQRSWRAGWSLAFASAIFVVLDYVTVSDDWFGLPAGPGHIVYLIAFVCLAGWWMMYFFSLEDFLQGFILAVIYLYLPMALFVLTFGYRWNLVFIYVLTWLKDPKPT